MYKIIIGFVIAIIIIGLGIWWNLVGQRQTNLPEAQIPEITHENDETITPPENTDIDEEIPLVSEVATNLEVPWGLVFLPNGDILLTERPGRVRLITTEGLQETPVFTLDVADTGESGLLGITIHPEFEENNYVYLYSTHVEGDKLSNEVKRYTYNNGTFENEEIIIENIPGEIFHSGGRIKFGPDGYLYITTGDAREPNNSQNIESLGGKILRITDTGEIPDDNPFEGLALYSYGHRNPQGITWDNKGNLWETEHGSTAYDELNKIEPGKNYGWPEIRGDETNPEMVSPVIHSGENTWAPSGLVFDHGTLFFAGLRGQTLYEYRPETGELRKHFNKQFGRIREVVLGPDDLLYIITNNTDGRGIPVEGDDRLIRINPALL